jgi:hypothetical protein
MKLKYLVLVLIIGIPAQSHGGSFSSSANGTATAEFLSLGVGGRMGAMGEAATALSDDAFALYWNPAGLTRIEKSSLGLMHALYLESSYFSYGSYARNVGNAGTVGVGYHYFTPGSIERTDTAGATVGDFKPEDQAVTLGYGFNVGNWAMGLSGKYISSKIVNSANTTSFDAGVLSPLFFNDRVRFGLVGRNLAGSLKYNNTSEDLPLDVRLGGTVQLKKNWILSLDQVFPKAGENFQAIGTEYVLSTSESFSLAGRAGYNTKWAKDKDGFAGASFGLGASFNRISLDYGILPLGDLGTTHRFSLTYKL